MVAYQVGQDIESKLTGGRAALVASTGTAGPSNYGAIETPIAEGVPLGMKIVHKQDISGCCHPAMNYLLCACLCPEIKRRTINWIGENARIRNYAYWCPIDHYCNCGTIDDISFMTIIDKKYEPFCNGCKAPLGANGFATEEDMTYCCFFINCSCLYNLALKPCFGECLFRVPCENGTFCFIVATRCLPCVAIPVDCCMADSAAYRVALMQQIATMRGTELTARQLRSIGKQAPEVQHMAR